jgi:hypothetical protein
MRERVTEEEQLFYGGGSSEAKISGTARGGKSGARVESHFIEARSNKRIPQRNDAGRPRLTGMAHNPARHRIAGQNRYNQIHDDQACQ